MPIRRERLTASVSLRLPWPLVLPFLATHKGSHFLPITSQWLGISSLLHSSIISTGSLPFSAAEERSSFPASWGASRKGKHSGRPAITILASDVWLCYVVVESFQPSPRALLESEARRPHALQRSKRPREADSQSHEHQQTKQPASPAKHGEMARMARPRGPPARSVRPKPGACHGSGRPR
jgi:hypothetical protein